MMPPYAFRLARPTKSFSHSNIKSPEFDLKNNQIKHNIVAKNAIDTMSEFHRSPPPEPIQRPNKNNVFSDKLWDNDNQIQTQTSLLYGAQKQIREVTRFLQEIGIEIDPKNCRQENIIEIILSQVKPSVSNILNINKELELKIQDFSNSFKNQEDTIRYLQETNRLLQSNELHIKHKFEGILKEWEEKCREIIGLHEEIEMKDEELVKLRVKVDNLGRDLNKIILNEETVNKQVLDESKRRIEIQKEYHRLKNQRDLENKQRLLLLNERESDLAESSIRIKVSDQKIRLIERKYEKLKAAYNTLIKQTQQKQHYFHQKVYELQKQLHSQIIDRKAFHQNQKALKQKLYTLENDNQELKQQLSELTDRFLKLKQFQKLDRASKKSINIQQ